MLQQRTDLKKTREEFRKCTFLKRIKENVLFRNRKFENKNFKRCFSLVYIIWRLKRFLYVFITLFIVLLKKKACHFYMFMLFWVGKQALLLVFVLLLARTADLKTWNPQRDGEKEQDALFLLLSLHGTAATERSHLAHELSDANQEAASHNSCSHVSLLHSGRVPGPAHISSSQSAAGVTGSWMPSFTFSHQSLMPQAGGPAPFHRMIWLLQNGRFACHALHDNALISSPQRTRCQSDKR